MQTDYLKAIRPELATLNTIFNTHGNRYKAHKAAAPLMQTLSQKAQTLPAIIKNYLYHTNIFALERLHPILAIPVHKSPHYEITMNVFPGFSRNSTPLSFQSIHHHGNLLLTTAAIWGEGYTAMQFSPDYTIHSDGHISNWTLTHDYRFRKGQVFFVDAYSPHVIFYPNTMSITLELWDKKAPASSEKMQGKVSTSATSNLQKTVASLGFTKKANANKPKYFDFYTDGEQFIALKDRLTYNTSLGNNNFLNLVFGFMQNVGFQDVEFLNNWLNNLPVKDAIKAQALVDELMQGKIIENEIPQAYTKVPYVNINRQLITNALRNQMPLSQPIVNCQPTSI